MRNFLLGCCWWPAHAMVQEDPEFPSSITFCYFTPQNITCLCDFMVPLNSHLHRLQYILCDCLWVGTGTGMELPLCGYHLPLCHSPALQALGASQEALLLPSLTHH